MVGLAVQNFVSAAVGMAVLVAVIRGIRGRGGSELGNFWQDLTRTLLYILLPLVVHRGADPRLPGRDPDPQRLRSTSHTLTGGSQTLALGPGGLADRDQAARHQRRRLLQRQLGLPVREPDRLLELRRDDLHPADPRRARLHLRPHGRQPAPGLGPVRGDGGADGRRAWSSPTRPSRTARPAQKRGRDRGWPPATATTGGNLEGKEQRNGIVASAEWATSPPTPRTARSTPRSTPTPGSAARCRWST